MLPLLAAALSAAPSHCWMSLRKPTASVTLWPRNTWWIESTFWMS